MTHPNRFSKTIALAILPLALGMYWLLAHASIADMDDQPPGYVSAVEMSNYDVSSGSSVIYRGDFFRGNWDGNLIAHKVDSSGGTTVTWQARAVLATQSWDSGERYLP
jgi:Tfp pilus tip-associated adhesin PilY1